MTNIRRRSRIEKQYDNIVSENRSTKYDSEVSDMTDGEDESNRRHSEIKPVDHKKVIIRTLTASTLATFFLCLLQTGHLYCILAGVLTQVNDNVFLFM